MNRVLIAVVVIAVLAASGLYLFNRRSLLAGNTNATNQSSLARYCSSDGELVNVMPIQSHRSYCVRTMTAPVVPNQAGDLSFQIVDDRGTTLKDFDTVHEKIMHVILARKDLTNFQHLHPDFDAATGTFTLREVAFATDGPYRMYADFTPSTSQLGPDGARLPVVDHDDLEVGSVQGYTPTPLGSPNAIDTSGAYQVSMTTSPSAPQTNQTTRLTFTITESDGEVTDLEKYLGELGHAVVLKDGDLSFLHTHPMDQDVDKQTGSIAFELAFPETGTYKTFMQFQHRGQVQTVEFILPEVVGTADDSESSDSIFHM
ncbi:MAG: hypothetical protein HY421_00760 [Candidatus Kerfeldbacteria bacterium]|nr:hypothetical protein [Candidatus Kerfeldbacteria bacterium]